MVCEICDERILDGCCQCCDYCGTCGEESSNFDSDEMGEEPEDEFERRTR
jgi:hypothetical protein